MDEKKTTSPFYGSEKICHESEVIPPVKQRRTGILLKALSVLCGAFSVLLCYHLTAYALAAGVLATAFSVTDRIKAGEFTSLPHVGLLCGVLGIFFCIVFLIWQ